jgi:hypothetical protein
VHRAQAEVRDHELRLGYTVERYPQWHTKCASDGAKYARCCMHGTAAAQHALWRQPRGQRTHVALLLQLGSLRLCKLQHLDVVLLVVCHLQQEVKTVRRAALKSHENARRLALRGCGTLLVGHTTHAAPPSAPACGQSDPLEGRP